MIDLAKFRDEIVQPALLAINLYSESAEVLVMATGLAESNLQFTVQQGNGPALGYFQIEPATHNWLIEKYGGQTKYSFILDGLRKLSDKVGMAIEMRDNPQYAAAMCRLRYFAVAAPIPGMYDIGAMAHMWKKYYNSEDGAGTIQEFIDRTKPLMSILPPNH